MSKIQVTLDTSKLRDLVIERSYKNKDGIDIVLKELKFELVEVKEPKEIYKKDNMRIMKTHFASVIQTKEQRQANSPTIYIGEGFTAFWDNPATIPVNQPIFVPSTDFKEEEYDDLPF